jgi:hypothetical protein
LAAYADATKEQNDCISGMPPQVVNARTVLSLFQKVKKIEKPY